MLLKTITTALLLSVSLYGLAVNGQSTFRVFRGDEVDELRELTDRERLAVAALTGGVHTIEFTGPSQAAVVQDDVSINLDCLPWLNQNPEGSVIRWSVVPLDEFGDPISKGL